MGDVSAPASQRSYLIAIHVALCRIGAVMTGIHLTFRESVCERALAFGEAVAIICEKAMGDFAIAETMLRLKTRVPSLEHVIVSGGGPDGTIALESLEDEPQPVANAPDASGVIHALQPRAPPPAKAVPLSYNNLLNQARANAGVFGNHRRHRIFCGRSLRISIRCTAPIFAAHRPAQVNLLHDIASGVRD